MAVVLEKLLQKGVAGGPLLKAHVPKGLSGPPELMRTPKLTPQLTKPGGAKTGPKAELDAAPSGQGLAVLSPCAHFGLPAGPSVGPVVRTGANPRVVPSGLPQHASVSTTKP